MSAAERGAAERVTVRLHREGHTWPTVTDGALGYGTGRPFEVILGFGGGPAWESWVVDVSMVIAGIYSPPSSPAGRGNVRIYRRGADCISVELYRDGDMTEAHFPADAFCRFVEAVIEMYEDPAPVADSVLASQIDKWRSDAT